MALPFAEVPMSFPATEQGNASFAQLSKRRRFQVPITRYFNPADPSAFAPEHTLSPPLPETVQSSLLTVGMRIRKSVPEGYKTILHKQLISQPCTLSSNSSPSTSYTELAPFCGLHKVGGLAVQPTPNPGGAYLSAYSSITLSAAEQEDPFSSPSSQESAATVASDSSVPSSRPNKRILDDIEDDEAYGDDDNAPLPSVPMADNSFMEHKTHHRRGSSYPFSHTRMPDLNTLMSSPPSSNIGLESSLGNHHLTSRAIAQPRSRRAAAAAAANMKTRKPSWEMVGQENSREWQQQTRMALDFENDFEDAEFLRRREDVEMGM
ncbi:hypothetical protein UCRPC4_g04755 [Phaeomoniella chlamydospora]|uniref:Uncharacterized protein n=1 Tax=Phaeomoniella chlamydospora TaxID=158046 RepID=A0A0G2G526_PHACM|nr:hypothetical protein UCRPC4_g04755 [Phaeomoniella chlamydospora]